MKIYEERIHTRIHKYFVKKICDMCGKESENRRNWLEELDNFEVDNVKIKHIVGYESPSGGCHKERSYTICPDCFKNKIEPVINAKPYEEEVDW